MMTVLKVYLIMILAFSSAVMADDRQDESQTAVVETVVSHTYDPQFLTQYWSLSKEEAQKYTEIMNGPLKYWNADIDPIMALGLFADNEADRKRYAKKYAEQEYELIQRTLAFQRSYRSEFNKLFPGANIIELEYLSSYYKHQNSKKHQSVMMHPSNINNILRQEYDFKEGDRVLYFADIECQSCSRYVNKITSMIQAYQNVYIDIYIVGIQNEQQARDWANDNKINIDWLKNGRLTLNINAGLYERILKNHDGIGSSRFYLSRDDSIFVIDQKQFGL